MKKSDVILIISCLSVTLLSLGVNCEEAQDQPVKVHSLHGDGLNGRGDEQAQLLHPDEALLAEGEGGGIGFGKITTPGSTTKRPTWRPPKGRNVPKPNDLEYQWPEDYYDQYTDETAKSIRLYGTFENKYKNYQAAMLDFYQQKARLNTTPPPKKAG